MTSQSDVRLVSVDLVRGLAIVGVVLFHIVWDLEFTGFLSPGIGTHPWWLLFGRTLAGTFLLLVGISLVLAHRSGMYWHAFSQRLVVIGCAALAISFATKAIFPERFIYFGILHAIAFASVIGVLFLRFSPVAVTAIGVVMIILPNVFSSSLFDDRLLAWIGFAAQPSPSNDYVPVFPWVGVTLLGVAIAKVGSTHSADRWIHEHEPRNKLVAGMAWLGRHSLVIYLLHQPVLLGLLIALSSRHD
jgi:uncharacterized membrane protein